MGGVPRYGYVGYLSVDMFLGATEIIKNLQLLIAGVAEYERIKGWTCISRIYERMEGWTGILRMDIGFMIGDDLILIYVDDNLRGKWLFVTVI